MVSGIRQRPGHYLALSLMMVSLSMPALMAFPAQATDAAFNLDAELTQPACAVAVDNVVFGDIPAENPGGWKPLSGLIKPVNIHLTDCGGGQVGRLPALTVTGTTMSGPGVNPIFAFRDVSSTSTGYAFAITMKQTFVNGDDLVEEFTHHKYTNREYIPIPDYTTAGAGPTGALDFSVRAMVTCGACDTPRSIGTLKSTVTMNYVYH